MYFQQHAAAQEEVGNVYQAPLAPPMLDITHDDVSDEPAQGLNRLMYFLVQNVVFPVTDVLLLLGGVLAGMAVAKNEGVFVYIGMAVGAAFGLLCLYTHSYAFHLRIVNIGYTPSESARMQVKYWGGLITYSVISLALTYAMQQWGGHYQMIANLNISLCFAVLVFVLLLPNFLPPGYRRTKQHDAVSILGIGVLVFAGIIVMLVCFQTLPLKAQTNDPEVLLKTLR